MNNQTIKQSNNILERLEKLPPQVKDVMFSWATADKMFDIGKQHNLSIDKIGEVTNETGLLMLGVTHPNDFVGNLTERLQIDRATASKIADDINREIFAPVREHLRALFSMPPAGNADGEQKPAPLQPRTENMEHGTWNMEQQKMKETSKTPQTPTTLEDLEAELERALAEEKGIQPLSVVRNTPAAEPATPPQPGYKGVDPYREQAGEDLPNVRPKIYAPQNMPARHASQSDAGGEHGTWNMEHKKVEIPPSLPFSKGGSPTLEKGGMGGFPKPVAPGARSSPPPSQPSTPAFRRDNSPFNPLPQSIEHGTRSMPARHASQGDAGGEHKKETSEERPPQNGGLTSKISPQQNGSLSAFRGFKMGAETPQTKKEDVSQKPAN